MTINPDYDEKICPEGTVANYQVYIGGVYKGMKPKPGNADIILGSPAVQKGPVKRDRLAAEFATAQKAVSEALP